MNQAIASLNVHFPNVDLVLDPHRLEDAYSMTVSSQVWRGLFRYRSDGEIEADLASNWKVAPDGLSLVVNLKKRTFSDGSPITSQHVIASIGRLLKLRSLISADLNYIVGTETFQSTGSLKDLALRTVEPNAVQFTFKIPNALFLHHLASPDCAILPILKSDTKITFGSKSAASGPYSIVDMSANRVVLKRWREDNSESSLPPERVTFFTSSTRGTELAARGQTDSLDKETISAEEESALTKVGWKRSVTEIVSERFIVLDPAVISARTRRYLFSKIDPHLLVKALQIQGLTAAWGPIPNGLPGGLTEPDRTLLRQELDTDPDNGELTIDFAGGNPINEKIVDWLIAKWTHPHLKIKKRNLTAAQYFKALFDRKSAFLLGAKGIDYFEGFSVLGYFRGSNPSNYYRVKDAEIDSLLDKAAAQMDGPTRLSAYQEIQRRVLRQAVLIPLLSGSTASGLWSPNVAFVPAHPLGMHSMAFETIQMKSLETRPEVSR